MFEPWHASRIRNIPLLCRQTAENSIAKVDFAGMRIEAASCIQVSRALSSPGSSSHSPSAGGLCPLLSCVNSLHPAKRHSLPQLSHDLLCSENLPEERSDTQVVKTRRVWCHLAW